MLVMWSNTVSAYNWKIIADSIASRQKEVCDSYYFHRIDRYKDKRKGYTIRRYIDSTVVKGDTVILMDYYKMFKISLNCTIWVKGKPNSFLTYDEFGHFNRDFTICFWPIYMRKLCEDWNISEIRKEEREHPEYPEEKQVYVMATRVIIKSEDEFSVDVIFFRSFRLYPRDMF